MGYQPADNVDNRRRFLKTVGSVTTAGLLAGCSGGDGSSGDGSDGDGSGSDSSGGETTSQSNYPQQKITVVVPFGQGGGTDYYARLLAKYLPKHLPNDVNTVVRNVTGATGRIAANQVYNSEPNGYKFLQGHLEVHTIGQLLNDTEYQVSEFTQLGSSAKAVRCWFGRTDILEQYDSWSALAEGMGSGDLVIATQGRGASGHVAPAIYGDFTGDYELDNLNFVHHDGLGSTIPTLKRGDAQVEFGTLSSALSHTQDDPDLSVFFTLDPENSNFPSQSDFGVPEDTASKTRNMFTNQRAIWGPPEISNNRTKILRQGIWDALHDEELLTEAKKADRPIMATKGANMEPIVNQFVSRWKKYVPLMKQLRGDK